MRACVCVCACVRACYFKFLKGRKMTSILQPKGLPLKNMFCPTGRRDHNKPVEWRILFVLGKRLVMGDRFVLLLLVLG